MANDKKDNEKGNQSGEDASEKKGGYQTTKNPGEKVRVARMTGDLDEPDDAQSKDEGEEADDQDGQETKSGDFGVTVRGKGEVQKKSQGGGEKKEESAEAQQGGEKGDEKGGQKQEPASEEEIREQAAREAAEKVDAGNREMPSLSDDDLEKQLGSGGEDATTEDFAALFEGQADSVPTREEYSTGDRVSGQILTVGKHNIFVQLDAQTEGIAKRREFSDDEGNLQVEEGETHEFYVTGVTEDEVYLGEQMGGSQGSIEALREAHESGVPVKGKVSGTNKGGFEVTIHGVDTFCPISEIELGYTEEKDVHVGNSYRFKVTEVRDGGRSVVVSRAAVLRAERAEEAKKTLEKLEEGQVVKGVVTRTAGFGAFVDLGGVEGLVHASELSHRYFDEVSDVVSEGEELEVEVLDIELPGEDADPDTNPRIGLSRKAVERDPWEVVNEEFAVGETVEGEVVRNAPFGSFVEIAPGVDGLVHISEMSWTEHVRTPDEVVEPGDKVTVQIQDIDLAKKRISLSMKAAKGNPWDRVGADYAEGMEVEGTIENIEDFGAFVKLSTGITALIPRSEMTLSSGLTPHRKYNEGETVRARVLNIDPAERKMALTTKESDEGAAASPETREKQKREQQRQSGQSSGSSDSSQSGGSFGTLGDLIGDQLDSDEE